MTKNKKNRKVHRRSRSNLDLSGPACSVTLADILLNQKKGFYILGLKRTMLHPFKSFWPFQNAKYPLVMTDIANWKDPPF